MSLDVSAPFSLDGRTAIVTGASSGLGERFARVLHAAGCTVIVGARRRERLDGLAADLGDRVVPVTCDVSIDDDLAALHAAALDAGGGHIDVLVNNAGVSDQIAAEIEDPATFRGVLDVNVTGVFVLSQLCARTMLEQGSGSIVNIASILGMVAAAPIMQASYCASKGAVVNLTRELACQWARRGIRVNAIAPGWFPSDMTNDEMFGTEEGMRFLRRNCPMGRGGEEHELDGLLLFLASDASSYVTGQTIAVDGGWVAR
jgi:NAD(P)-dependent dehydrogenase (short-subunit alcohol dehydrogenase family)